VKETNTGFRSWSAIVEHWLHEAAMSKMSWYLTEETKLSPTELPCAPRTRLRFRWLEICGEIVTVDEEITAWEIAKRDSAASRKRKNAGRRRGRRQPRGVK